MTRGIRLTGLTALAFLAALVVFLSAEDTHAAPPPFEPGGTVCLENFESGTECDGDTAPGAAADLRSKFCIGWNDDCSKKDSPVSDSNFGGIVGFTPKDWTLPAADAIPFGAIAGRLESEATLGLLNGECSKSITVAFTMLNASVNLNDTIPPKPEGKTDVMEPLALDTNTNGVPDGADKYPTFLKEFFKDPAGNSVQPRSRLFGISHIQGSWISLNFVFFEPGASLEIAKTQITFNDALGYPGITILQDPTAQAAPGAITDFCAPLISQNIGLGKTLNNPCTPTRVEGANCPTGQDGPPEVKTRGYPLFPCDTGNVFDEDADGKINDGCPQLNNVSESGADCDNNTSDDGEDSLVNDGCPAFGDQSEGSRLPGACSATDEGGCTYRSNPTSSGTFPFTSLALSQRDADGDGLENSLDVCALIANGEWNPRTVDNVNDRDLDGLPNACDPAPDALGAGSPTGCKSGYTGADQDQDCFSNRADNCPTNNQLQDPTKPADETTNIPKAPDADSDGIGDACDPDLNAVNGEYIGYCLKFAVEVGGAAGAKVGTRESQKAPECAATVVSSPAVVTSAPTPRSSGTSGTGNNNTGGVSGGPAGGVGSLSPTGTSFPVWAAILAGIGAIGILSGLTLLSRLAPRRGRR